MQNDYSQPSCLENLVYAEYLGIVLPEDQAPKNCFAFGYAPADLVLMHQADTSDRFECSIVVRDLAIQSLVPPLGYKTGVDR